MKRTAFIIHGLDVGGAEKFFLSIVNRYQEMGLKPLVILFNDHNPLINEVHKDVELIKVTRTFKYDLSVSRRVREILHAKEIEKVFCVGTYSFFLVKMGLLRDKKIKLYLSLHSTIPRSLKDFVQNFVYMRFIGNNDEVLFICNGQKIYVEQKYSSKFHHSRVIYNGIDTDFFNPDMLNTTIDTQDSIRKRFGIANDEKVILKVATIRIEKGHRYAIEALALLHKGHGIKAHLLFVGGGAANYVSGLKELATSLGVDKFVHFAGNQTDVRTFYHASDLFTLTSYSIETFSLAALEAMAFGLPCSLTDIGGAREMVIENKTGLISKPKDSASIADTWYRLLTLNTDKSAIRQYVVNQFSLKNMIREYHEILQ